MMTLFECQCSTIVSRCPSYISRNREMVKDLLGMLYNLYRPWDEVGTFRLTIWEHYS
jgi:hypothetical protein